MAFVLASKKKKIPSIQSMKNIRKARESTRHEKAWMSRASRFLASHTFSLPTLHTLSFLAISRTPRFLVPHVSSRLELSREERLLLRTGIMQNFCYFSTKNDVSIPRNVDLKYNIFQNWLLSLWSPERCKVVISFMHFFGPFRPAGI